MSYNICNHLVLIQFNLSANMGSEIDNLTQCWSGGSLDKMFSGVQKVCSILRSTVMCRSMLIFLCVLFSVCVLCLLRFFLGPSSRRLEECGESI